MEKTNIVIEAERLRVFRKAENLTMEELANILGKKNHTTVQRYESGKYNIPISVVKSLHEKLKMSYEWFYHGKGSRLYIEEKSNLVRDIKTQETSQKILENRVESLERTVKRLVRDFYHKKSLNPAQTRTQND